MALTQINSEGIKDSEVKTIDIADQGGCDHFYGYRIGD